jgi:hypothetical protein
MFFQAQKHTDETQPADPRIKYRCDFPADILPA